MPQRPLRPTQVARIMSGERIHNYSVHTAFVYTLERRSGSETTGTRGPVITSSTRRAHDRRPSILSGPLPAGSLRPTRGLREQRTCVLLFGLATGGAYRVSLRQSRHRHCGAGPRLAADGCYPPPLLCVAPTFLTGQIYSKAHLHCESEEWLRSKDGLARSPGRLARVVRSRAANLDRGKFWSGRRDSNAHHDLGRVRSSPLDDDRLKGGPERGRE